MIPWWLTLATALFLLCVMIVCPPSRRGNGRHVSRFVRRILGVDPIGAHGVQALLILAAAAGYALALNVEAWSVNLVVVIWILDDFLTGGPGGRKRRYQWAKVKLRMPKPVKLRPAERWAPAPA